MKLNKQAKWHTSQGDERGRSGWRTAAAMIRGGAVVVMGKLIYDARGGLRPIVDGAELSGGAITVKDDYTAAFLMPSDDGGFVLVDCGVDANGAAIKAALARKT